jgi:UDP-3-O-[3-hydroxymyristoyl] glucosamine N-acyltransferase
LKSLKEILTAIGVSIENVPDVWIAGPAKLSDAQPNDVSFLHNMKYEQELYSTQAGVILVPKGFLPKAKVEGKLLELDNPYDAITKILQYFSASEKLVGISELAVIDKSSKLADDVFVGAYSIIGKKSNIDEKSMIHPQVYVGNNVSIGKNTIIYPGVKILDNCLIGNNCIIHSGTVIGADGFGFAPQQDGSYQKIPQTGNVVIMDDVEIGSNCCIDRATMGSTFIHKGVKLDNLIQVGHNAIIGENTVVAAQAGISGSTEIGKGCMIGGQVGFVGHISIAPFTLINAKSGISKSIKKEGSKVNGIPAFSFTDSLRSQAVYRRLPNLEKRIEEIEEILSLLRK